MTRRIYLPNKTGFQVNDVFKPIVIRDFRGVLFYDTSPLLPRVTNFNLPAGEYFVDSGNFKQLARPNPVTLSTLPIPERFFPSSKGFKIEFGNNPNKCTIFWDEKRILFDTSFKEKPLPIIWLIRYHEEGHEYYTTEKYADLYASNEMLKAGFNESQIGLALINSLSHNQYERKQYITNRIIKRNNSASSWQTF